MTQPNAPYLKCVQCGRHFVKKHKCRQGWTITNTAYPKVPNPGRVFGKLVTRVRNVV